jgi:hypothetical protein
VLALLEAAGAPGRGGPDEEELATPTGVALATTLAAGFGPMPALRPTATGTGAGTRDPAGRPNVVRLVVGEAQDAAVPSGTVGGLDTTTAVVLEANVDDLDPRAWPLVLAALLDAGALDAWLTPTLMKKGRPAHVVAALAGPAEVARVRDVLLRETTTLGVRETPVVRYAVRRTFGTVHVDGHPVAVKLGWGSDGSVVNAMPEWEDVARAAALLDRPVKQVLAQAVGLAEALRSARPGRQ